MAAAKLPKKERTQMDAIDVAIEYVLLCEDANKQTGEKAKLDLADLRTNLARLTEEKAELEGTIRDWASSVPPSELVTLKAENKALTEENTRLREALKSAKWALEGGSDDDAAYDEICAALVKGEAK